MLALLRILILLVTIAPILGRPAGQDPTVSGAAQQCAPSPVPVGFAATLYSSQLSWNTAPFATATAQLDIAGRGTYSSTAIADLDGDILFRFADADGTPMLIEPGAAIRILPSAGAPIDAIAPHLVAHVDPASAVIHAAAPPESVLCLYTLDGSLQRLIAAIDVDPSGRVSQQLDLADRFELGSLIFESDDGHQFAAAVAGFDSTVRVGGNAISGRASAGTTISMLATRQDGERVADELLVDASRRWQFDTHPGFSLQAGSNITLTLHTAAHESPPIAFAVPQLTVTLDAAQLNVAGKGPAGATIDLVLSSSGGGTTTHRVVADPEGSFNLPLDPDDIIGPAWRIDAYVELRPGIRAWNIAQHLPMDIRLYTGHVSGITDIPGARVALSLWDAAGHLKSDGWTDSVAVDHPRRPAGSFAFTFGQHTIQPGDVLEIDWREGDAIRLVMPTLAARADLERDEITGTAPPGSRLQVIALSGRGFGQDTVTLERDVAVGPSGAFQLSVAGTLDITEQSIGRVTIVDDRGYLVSTHWAPMILTWSAESGLEGTGGVHGQSLEVKLLSPEGDTVGAYVDVYDGSTHRWTADLRNSAGEIQHAMPGDTFLVRNGSVAEEFSVPNLTAAAHVSDNVLSGMAPPQTHVAYAVWGGERFMQGSVESDMDGFYNVDFGESFDIQYNDNVAVEVPVGRVHRARRSTYSPGVTVDLDMARVHGAHEPGRTVDILVERGGQVVGRGSDTSNDYGHYEMIITGTDGTPLRFLEHDVLRATVADSLRSDGEFEVTVPMLSMSVDSERRMITGQASIGGALQIRATPTFIRSQLPNGAGGHADVEISSDGTYVVDFSGGAGPDFRPGQQFNAQYQTADGHFARRKHVTAIINAQHGGAIVCGFAEPQQAVVIKALRDGGLFGQGTGEADATGAFQLTLVDERGDAVPMRSRDDLQIAWDDRYIEMRLPELDVTPTWTQHVGATDAIVSRLEIQGEPRRDAYVSYPVEGCTDSVVGRNSTQPLSLSASGTAQLDLPVLEAGDAVRVASYTATGHRYFSLVRRPRATVYLRTSRIDAVASSFASLRFELSEGAGNVRGRLQAEASADGVMSGHLRSTQGMAVRSEPGHSLSVWARQGRDGEMDDDVQTIVLPELDFDFSKAGGLVGRAPGGEHVNVVLGLEDGSSHQFGRPIGPDGVFQYAAADVPVRAGWSLDDVAFVRVSRTTDFDHEVVVDTRVGADNATRRTALLFMPIGLR